MMPMAGCDVTPSSTDKLGFTIRHMNRVYNIQCFNESDHAEWLASLILSANAKLPNEVQTNNKNEMLLKPVKRSASIRNRIINSTNFINQNQTSLNSLQNTKNKTVNKIIRKYT